jgi:hypothetical protein
VGAARQGRHRDGVVTVSFAGASPARPEEAADLVVTSLAAALGVSLAVPRDPREVLADALAGRQLLLVLDNLEQLRDAAGVLAGLLARAPGVQVPATGAPGEAATVEQTDQFLAAYEQARGRPWPPRSPNARQGPGSTPEAVQDPEGGQATKVSEPA